MTGLLNKAFLSSFATILQVLYYTRETDSTNTARIFCAGAMQEKLSEAEKRVKELQERFGVEEAKTIEMGTELLTLVNQKAHLEKVTT